MSNPLLDNLLNKGELPTVNVEVTVDDRSIYKIAFAILAVSIIAMLLHRIFDRHTK